MDFPTAQDNVTKAQELVIAGNVDTAVAMLEEIVEAFPGYEFALRTLGYLYHGLGRSLDAINTIERAIDLDPQETQIKNLCFFRTQVAFKMLDGLPPNEKRPDE